MQRALVTGGAGFIGSHLVDRLLSEGWCVSVVDNFDDYYSPTVKEINVRPHLDNPHYVLIRVDITDMENLRKTVKGPFDAIIHLAARAGVRASLNDPVGYHLTNVIGTQALLELARALQIPRFVYASSSSVYGNNPRLPWREEEVHLRPISPYAATKVSGEALGHAYSHLYGIYFLALRFFTVYGPRQRPDLAIYNIATRMLTSSEVLLYGDGSSARDYTYVSDIVSGIRNAITYSGPNRYEVFNLGNGRTISLSAVVSALELELGVKARVCHVFSHSSDVALTCADISKAREHLGYCPKIDFPAGLHQFIEWLHSSQLPEMLMSMP